ncbi:hypothetical protein [Lyngbya sp. PCC 8106]|uniref:hypothetical protein n=1 Tax=Lyngbya sp. (strain PCC 8106) TaxID=313612 RepID=UPI0000EACB4D|nr:hypothetical protein [Lyngbya sp. PCC 8106]EAW34055.1 hypothetical protein L8106_26547 [Lyngbya sp. PCC 8106]
MLQIAQLTKTLLKNKALTFLASLSLCATPSLFLSPSAQAEIKFPVQEMTTKMKGRTSVPILLPSNFPSDRGSVFFEEKVNPQGYLINFTATPNCRATACRQGGMSAESSGMLTPPPPKSDSRSQYQTILLANGIEGQYYNGCRLYCTALVEWRYQGVLYRVTLKNGSLEDLQAIANSAIEGGSRSF